MVNFLNVRAPIKGFRNEAAAKATAEELQDNDFDGWMYIVVELNNKFVIEVRDDYGDLVDYWRE